MTIQSETAHEGEAGGGGPNHGGGGGPNHGGGGGPNHGGESGRSGTNHGGDRMLEAAAEMERLHPFTLLYRLIVSLPALVVVLLPVLRSPDANAWISVAIIAVYGIAVFPLMLLQYFRFRYAVTPDEIIIHKGVFTYQHRNIPIERIQNIEIEQRLLPRMLGMAKVKIETAGSSSTEGVIEYVALEHARAIRESVRAHQRALKENRGRQPEDRGPFETDRRRSEEDRGPSDEDRRTYEQDRRRAEEDRRRHEESRRLDEEDRPKHDGGRSEREDDRRRREGEGLGREEDRAGREQGDGEGEAPAELLHSMSLRRVLLSGAFRFSLLYIAMIFTATEYLGIAPEDVARWISGNRMDAFNEALEDSLVLVVLSTVVVVSGLAWITGIFTNLNRFYGFRLGYEDGKLQTRHGLLTVSEGTIPLKKIQALIIRTNPVMRAFGWYRLELQTMGFDTNDRGYRVAAPFARKDEILSIAQRIRPFALPERFRSVSKLMIRRTFARYSFVFLPAIAAVTYFWEWGPWLLIGLPVLYVLAERQYRNHGFDLTDAYLFIRRGVFRKYLWILPAERFQVFYLTQTIFQRRLGVQSLYVDTPGAGALAHPVVVDLPEDEARSVFDAAYGAFQRLFRR